MDTTREEKVRQTLAQFCHLTDDADFDAWVGLFTEDGSFHLSGQIVTGHEALRAFIELDQPPEHRGLHMTSDSVIAFDGDVATVRSKFIFVGAGETAGVVVAAGTYHDVLVPRGDRWLFRERACVLFSAPATARWGSRSTVDASQGRPHERP